MSPTSVNESFKVLVNVPENWRSVGAAAKKQKRLDSIKGTWTDMGPLSLRKQMVEHQAVCHKPPG